MKSQWLRFLLVAGAWLTGSQASSAADCGVASPYVAGNQYLYGELVSSGGEHYRCEVVGWCSSASSFYYAPGSGLAWEQAWSQVTCNGDSTDQTTEPALPSDPEEPDQPGLPTEPVQPVEPGVTATDPDVDAAWLMDAPQSQLRFVTTKKERVQEVQRFSLMEGDLTGQGNLRLRVALASIDSGIALRDERMRALLFTSDWLPSVYVTATIDGNLINQLAVGAMRPLDTRIQVSLNGVQQSLDAALMIWRQSDSQLRVFSRQPLLLDGADFALDGGIEALRALAGLSDIGNTVPVYVETRWRKQSRQQSGWPARPANPQALVVDTAGDRQVELRWADMAQQETGYLVQMQTPGGGWQNLAMLDANEQRYSLSLDAAGNYRFRVSAVNNGRVSATYAAASYQLEGENSVLPEPTEPAAGARLYVEKECQACHGADGTELVSVIASPMSQSALADYIALNMPYGKADDCVGDCASAIAGYIVDTLYPQDGSTDPLLPVGPEQPTEPGQPVQPEQPVAPQLPHEPDAIAGADLYRDMGCSNCHGTDGNTGREIISHQRSQEALAAYISASMPLGNAALCEGSCADDIAAYIRANLYRAPVNVVEGGRGARGVRLLTPREFANAVADLTGVSLSEDTLPKAFHDSDFKYPTQADKGVVNYEAANRLLQLLAPAAASADLTRLGCAAAGCSDAQIASAAERLWRRPLTSSELSSAQSFNQRYGSRDWLTAMMLAPDFLYLSLRGEWDTDAAAYRLSHYEVAAALSFQMWGTTPDAALLTEARNQRLGTAVQIKAQAERLMADVRFNRYFVEFIRHYTHTEGSSSEKPGLTLDVIAAMVEEQRLAVNQWWQEGAQFNALFNPGYTYLNARLAAHYGLSGPGGNSFAKVETDDQRGGILHQGITQILNSDFAATSLVKRGKMIRENLLCHDLGVPVGIDPATIDMPSHPVTTRERWNVITGPDASEGQCWQCHQLMNDPGAALEHFDQAGRYRTTETAYNAAGVELAINASGILRSNDANTELAYFNDARELAGYLGQSNEAKACFAQSFLRFASGRSPDHQSQSQPVIDAFVQSGDVKALILQSLMRDAFFLRLDR